MQNSDTELRQVSSSVVKVLRSLIHSSYQQLIELQPPLKHSISAYLIVALVFNCFWSSLLTQYAGFLYIVRLLSLFWVTPFCYLLENDNISRNILKIKIFMKIRLQPGKFLWSGSSSNIHLPNIYYSWSVRSWPGLEFPPGSPLPIAFQTNLVSTLGPGFF